VSYPDRLRDSSLTKLNTYSSSFFVSHPFKHTDSINYVVDTALLFDICHARDEFRDGDLRELYEVRSPIAILWHCAKDCFQFALFRPARRTYLKGGGLAGYMQL